MISSSFYIATAKWYRFIKKMRGVIISLRKLTNQNLHTNLKSLVSSERKILVEQLSNKTFAESKVLVAHYLNIQPKEQIKTIHQKDEYIRLEITFSKTQWQKLVKMRELVSNSLPNGSNWDQVFEYVSSQGFKKKDKSRFVNKKNSENKTNSRVSALSRKPVSMAIQRKIHQRNLCCQYQDKQTGKQCKSTWRLNIDHIQPVLI